MIENLSKGDPIQVKQQDGTVDRVYFVGVADETAGEQAESDTALAFYSRNLDIEPDPDEPVIEYRYAIGYDIDGDPAVFTEELYSRPISWVESVENDEVQES